MLVKSGLLSQMSGSLAGVTAARNRGGQYLRARTIPVQPGTAPQVAIRGHMSTLSTRWVEDVTQTQRDDWAVYAVNVSVTNRLGDSVQLSGQQHYLRSNVARLLAALDIVDDAPTVFDLGTFTNPTITASAATQVVTIAFDATDEWDNETDSAMLSFISRPQNASINYFKGPYQFLSAAEGVTGTPPAGPDTGTSPFTFIAGQKLFAQIRVTRADGRYSGIARVSAIAGA